jgi:hypothetical protein
LAKLGVDMGVLCIIFISNDGVAVDFLKSKSTISRSVLVLEITKINDQLTIEYLCSPPEGEKAGMPRDNFFFEKF